jgi:hypothetical protein
MHASYQGGAHTYFLTQNPLNRCQPQVPNIWLFVQQTWHHFLFSSHNNAASGFIVFYYPSFQPYSACHLSVRSPDCMLKPADGDTASASGKQFTDLLVLLSTGAFHVL